MYRNKHYLTAVTTSSVPPVYTNSCHGTLRSVSLQAGASVIATIAIINGTGFQVRQERYMLVTWFKHTRTEPTFLYGYWLTWYNRGLIILTYKKMY